MEVVVVAVLVMTACGSVGELRWRDWCSWLAKRGRELGDNGIYEQRILISHGHRI